MYGAVAVHHAVLTAIERRGEECVCRVSLGVFLSPYHNRPTWMPTLFTCASQLTIFKYRPIVKSILTFVLRCQCEITMIKKMKESHQNRDIILIDIWSIILGRRESVEAVCSMLIRCNVNYCTHKPRRYSLHNIAQKLPINVRKLTHNS